MTSPFALILGNLDNLVLNNYWRKYYTYSAIGWDSNSIQTYLSKKEYMMQIASFNTTTITFSASSRRNRFYEIYNKEEMLDQDTPWDSDVITALNSLVEKYSIYIITARKEHLREKTLEVLTRLGFPVTKLHFYFLPPNKNLAIFRQNAVKEIKTKHPYGVGISINPNGSSIFNRSEYPVYGFTSLKETTDFQNKTHSVVDNWGQLAPLLSSYSNQLTHHFETIAIQTQQVKNAINKDDSTSEKKKKEKTPESALEKVIFQQLFLGSDNILGKFKSESFSDRGFTELLHIFTEDIKSHIKLILKENRLSFFFKYFSNKYEVDFLDIQIPLELNIGILMEKKGQEFMMVYLVLTKFLEKLREHAFSSEGKNFIDQTYRKLSGKPLPETHLKKIKQLIQDNDDDVSILYNLSFMVWLSKINYEEQIDNNAEQLFLIQANKILANLFL
jgi:hypothetical protein